MTSTSRVAFAFKPDSAHSSAFWAYVRNLSQLAGAALTRCDLLIGGGEVPNRCVLRFGSTPIPAGVLERLSFWAEAQGGARVAGDLANSRAEALWDDLAPSLLPRVADALDGVPDEAQRHLRIDLDARSVECVALGELSATLFLASAHAPPLGDTIPLRYRTADGAVRHVAASVTARTLGSDAGTTGGFTVEVGGADPAFSEWASKLPTRSGAAAWLRRAQRIPLRVLGQLTTGDGTASDVIVDNVSLSGAFVVGGTPLPVGSDATLSFPVAGEQMTLRARVVRTAANGTGMRFHADPFAALRLAARLERLAEAPRRVLVVDDDGLARRMLSDSLEERGLQVTAVTSGDAALSTLRAERRWIDAVVTDLCMPGLSGEELVRSLRDAGEESMPIIAMTAGAEAEAVRRIETAGVDVVLFKSAGAQSIADAASALARKRFADVLAA